MERKGPKQKEKHGEAIKLLLSQLWSRAKIEEGSCSVTALNTLAEGRGTREEAENKGK